MEKGNRVLTILALGTGLFMAMLDGTIVNISIPAMMSDFHTSVGTISWVLDGYLLVLAVLALTMGRLADQFGRRLLYVIGLAVFTVGSLLCALSWDVGWLIGFRVLQGVGSAIIIPVSMAILTAAFPAEKRGSAMGIWAAIGITAAAVGPSLGGVIVEWLNWHWVFYINLPIGAIAMIVTLVGVEESRDPASPKTLDLVGMGLLSASVFCLVLAVIKGEDWGWASGVIVGLLIAAAVVCAAFVLWERRQTRPMLDVTLFGDRTFSSAVFCQALVAFGMLGAMFLLTLFLQRILGYSVLKAAVAITPIPASALVFSPIAGRLSDKIGTRLPTAVGVVALALGVYLFSRLGVESTWGDVAWRAVIMGVGVGLANAPLAVAAMGSAPKGKEGVGSGVLNTSRMIGMTLGVAICTALLTSAMPGQIAEAKTAVRAIVTQDQQIPEQGKALLLAQIDQMGGAGATQSMPDISALARQQGVPAALLPAIDELSGRITKTIRTHLTSAFAHVFPWAAVITGIGVIPAIMVENRRRRREGSRTVETSSGATERPSYEQQ